MSTRAFRSPGRASSKSSGAPAPRAALSATPTRAYDAVVVGGGHNGLVCAAYLAQAGLSVCVLERRAVLGGAATTEEFHPGFRNSVASYTVSLLHPRVIADLGLARHGLRIVARPFSNFLPQPDGRYLAIGGGMERTVAQVAGFSSRDAQCLPEYYALLERVAAVVRELLLVTPPDLGARGALGFAAAVDAWKTAKVFRRLDLSVRRDVLDLFTKSAGDVLERRFEAPALQGAFGFDAVVGHFASPYSAGSAYVLLHHVLGEVNGQRGQWGHAIGGMGAITQAMAAECRARGVVLRTETPVREVLVKSGRAIGVELASGEHVAATRVVANVTPHVLFRELVAAAHLDADFLSRIDAYRSGSASFRMNLALSELPDFSALPGKVAAAHHASGIVLSPSLDYLEDAYVDARKLGWSRAPVVELLIPSVVDATLAPPSMHVASLFAQHAHPDLPKVAGRPWDSARGAIADTMIEAIDRVAPNFRASIIAQRALTPDDLERELGLTRGDIFHGALTLDQLFAARPVLGNARYRAPVRGLYMCGAGTHPGGGVSGVPGFNCAREVLRDAKKSGRRSARR